MSRSTIMIAFLVLSFGIGATVPENSPSVLMEKAIYKEETEGDLNAAMDIYRKIVSQAPADRAVTAQAYLRLGMCHLKNGDKPAAAKMLETVLDRYSDQTLAAVRARKNMPDISLTLPPQVLRTSPAALADNVSPTLKEITVVFNQKMTDRSWSWTGGDRCPQTTGAPCYDAAVKICKLPVKLEPGKVYWIGINGPNLKNFKNAAGLPAREYVIPFATKGADGRPTPIPAELLAEARRINAAHRSGTRQQAGGEPVVVSTVPQMLSDNVSPSLSKINVTFNQPMRDRTWSWTGGGETFPKISGQPYYDDKRTTCNLPVQLEPGKVYWIGVNSPSHRDFRSRTGLPARRYVILFATQGPDGKSTPIPEAMAAQARQINDASGSPK